MIIVSVADDPVVFRSHPPFAGASDELNRFWRSWIGCEEVDRGLGPARDSSAARISVMSSANSIRRSRSSASMTAATRWPRRDKNTGSWLARARLIIEAS